MQPGGSGRVCASPSESLELEVAVIEGLKQTHDSGVGSGQAAAAWALVHDL